MAEEATHLVLVQEKEGLWRELGRVTARDKRDALAAALNGNAPPEQPVVVLSMQTFRPGRVVPVQVYDIDTDAAS